MNACMMATYVAASTSQGAMPAAVRMTSAKERAGVRLLLGVRLSLVGTAI